MKTLLSIDPGVRGCGCAYWVEGVLQRAEYVKGSKDGERSNAWITMAVAVDIWRETLDKYITDDVIIELPRVYPGARQKGDQNDLIELASVVGAISAYVFARDRKAVYPYEWKQQVPKDIHHARALARLTAQEKARIVPCAKSLAHNVYDGIAMGLTHLKRM